MRLVVARKVLKHVHPAIATQREIYQLRGKTTTSEEFARCEAYLSRGNTCNDVYYKLKDSDI